MKHSAPFKFKGASDNSSGSDKKRYSAIASTDALDRDREVLLPKGCVTENFMKNPVMLHIHDYRHVPVGKVLSINIDEKEITFDFEFADTDIAKEIEEMYTSGFMSAFSVGLYPLKSMWIDEETPEKFEVEVADGKKQDFDLTKYTITPRRLVHQWELLEISPVPVPSNPEALLQRATEGVIRKYMEADHSPAQGQLLSQQVGDKFANLNTSVKSFLNDLSECQVKKAVCKHATSIVEESWDGSKARALLAKWASEDASGDKAKMDWGKFAKGFGWVDTAKADAFTAYKLPHHIVDEKGDLIAVWRGVTGAMATLLGEDHGIDLDDRKDVYDHLAKHYADNEKVTPEFGEEYTEEELKAIEEDGWEDYLETLSSSSDDTSDDAEDDKDASDDADDKSTDESNEVVKSLFAEMTSNLEEMEETIRLRMNILVNMFEEMHQDIKELSSKSQVTEDNSDDDSDDKDTSDEVAALTNRFNELSSLLQVLQADTQSH